MIGFENAGTTRVETALKMPDWFSERNACGVRLFRARGADSARFSNRAAKKRLCQSSKFFGLLLSNPKLPVRLKRGNKSALATPNLRGRRAQPALGLTNVRSPAKQVRGDSDRTCCGTSGKGHVLLVRVQGARLLSNEKRERVHGSALGGFQCRNCCGSQRNLRGLLLDIEVSRKPGFEFRFDNSQGFMLSLRFARAISHRF